MLKLMIVDDEPVIRNGLRDGFDWASMGYEVCAVAADGLDAVPLLEAHHPDVVITDIAMNRMDGLELLRYIKEHGLSAKTVVLSGFDNFEYAQKAIQFGAVNYLLKPLEDSEVYRLFQELRATILQEQSKQEKYQTLEKVVELSQQDIIEKGILDFLTGSDQDADQVLFILKHYCGQFDALHSFLAVVDCDDREEFAKLTGYLQRETASNNTRLCLQNGQEQLLVFGENREPRTALEQLLSSYGGREHLRCIYSECPKPFPELREVYQQPVLQPEHRFYLDYGSLYPVQLSGRPAGGQTEAESRDVAELLDALVADGKEQECRIILHRYFRQFSLCHTSPDVVRIKLSEVYQKLAELLKNRHSFVSVRPFEEIYLKFQRCSSYSQLTAAAYEALLELTESYSQNKNLSVAAEIQQYIREHYAERLSLTTLSEHFYLNPSYLSSLFCQKTGKTISNYIKDVRMEQAKKLLLDSKLSISEIAERVGYQNYRYFCKLFKSEFHQPPLSFRINQPAGRAEERKEERV